MAAKDEKNSVWQRISNYVSRKVDALMSCFPWGRKDFDDPKKSAASATDFAMEAPLPPIASQRKSLRQYSTLKGGLLIPIVASEDSSFGEESRPQENSIVLQAAYEDASPLLLSGGPPNKQDSPIGLYGLVHRVSPSSSPNTTIAAPLLKS